MPKFYMTYHGGNQPSSPEEGKAHMQKYMMWIKDLGEAAISPMNPIGKTKSITADGVTDGAGHPSSGFTIVEAADMDTALAIAKACPFLETGGTMEVSELKQMPGS